MTILSKMHGVPMICIVQNQDARSSAGIAAALLRQRTRLHSLQGNITCGDFDRSSD